MARPRFGTNYPASNWPLAGGFKTSGDNISINLKDAMPNIATVLKAEIARISRKEMKAETERLQAAVAQGRKDIAALKRQVATLERLVKQVTKKVGKESPLTVDKAEPSTPKIRFSPARLAAHRQKLGLTANEFGALVGVSGQSIYKWETEKAYPRAKQLGLLAVAMKLSKSEAMAKLSNT